MNPADRNLVPTTVLPAGSRAQSLTAIDLSGWKRVGLFPSVVNSKVTRIGGRALAIQFKPSWSLTQLLKDDRDGRAQLSMLSFYHKFFNEAGGPSVNENTLKRQRMWLESQVRTELPGGKDGVIEMLSAWACLIDHTYVKNTAALIEGSIWTERFSSTSIQASAKDEVFQKKLQKLARGDLAKFLCLASSEPKPSLEESDSDSQPAVENSSEAGSLHDAPVRVRPQSTSAERGKPHFDITRDKTSEIATVNKREDTSLSVEQALLEKFTKEGIALISQRGRQFLRDIKDSGRNMVNGSQLTIEGTVFPHPLQTPRFACIDLAKQIIQVIDGASRGSQLEGRCALLLTDIVLLLTNEVLTRVGIVALARALEEYSEGGMKLQHQVFALAATLVHSDVIGFSRLVGTGEITHRSPDTLEILSADEIKLLKAYLADIEEIVTDKKNNKITKTSRDAFLHLVSELRKSYNFTNAFSQVSRQNPFISGTGLLAGLQVQF